MQKNKIFCEKNARDAFVIVVTSKLNWNVGMKARQTYFFFLIQKYTRDLAQSLFLYKSDGRTDVCVCVNMLVCRCLGTFKMNSKFINIFCCCSIRINKFFSLDSKAIYQHNDACQLLRLVRLWWCWSILYAGR